MVNPHRSPAIIATAAGSLLASPALAQPSDFTEVPLFGGGTALGLNNLSGDGNVPVGSVTISGQARAFRWTRQGGPVLLGTLPGGSSSVATGANQDGSVIVGVGASSSGQRAWRYAGGVMTSLGVLPNTNTSNANSVSADGTVAIGTSSTSPNFYGFRWTAATGMTDLGTMPGFIQNVQGMCVSRDGQVVVGRANMTTATVRAFRWQSGSMQDIGVLPGKSNGQAFATSATGSVIVGWSSGSTTADTRPYRWVQGAGMQDLGLVPGASNVNSNFAISGDGATVGGGCNFPGSATPHAYLWTAARGIQDLNTLLPSLGINLNGLTLTTVGGISDDGSVIVGNCQSATAAQHGWVLDLRNDSDGDGLLDDWEINGIPYTDASGQPQRYPLPGANPMHKDLYVEVDRMTGLSVDTAAIDMVVQAFADSPLTNPDGTTGVTLHVQVDEGDLPYIHAWHTSSACWPDSFDENFMLQHYGTAAERADPRGLPLRIAKQKAYRYGVLADLSDADMGGCGKIGGDVFTVYTGGVGPRTEHQAAAFMHEFGHNLGLHHGGGDEDNGKPNYPSIMNYVVAYKAPWNEDFWRLDYSRVGPEGFATLPELSLDEQAGIGTVLGQYHNWVMPFGVNLTPGGTRAVRYVVLNGSPTDYGRPDGSGVPDGQYSTDIIQDLNYLVNPPPGINMPSQSSGADQLAPYNDWEHVVLATYAARGPNSPIPSVPTHELQITTRDWIAQNFPPRGAPPCYANCDASTQPPVLNVADFSCFLQKYAAADPYANCDASTQAPVLNVADFSCFLQKYAAGCP